MKIGIIGIDYVGLPSVIDFLELGNNIICMDINKNKIDKSNQIDSLLFIQPGII